jgi:putative ATP-dependent endonuclease of the OLD family
VCTFAGWEAGEHREQVATVTWTDGHRAVTVRPDPDEDLPLHRVVHVRADTTLAELVSRHADVVDADGLASAILDVTARVLPNVSDVDTGSWQIRDVDGFVLTTASAARICGAIGLAHHLATRGVDVAAVLLEEPEAFLHPAAQEDLRDLLEEVAVDTDAPVIATTESPFVVPRSADSQVVALARDPLGATRVTGAARGNEPHAPLVGGLFRDAGFAAVIDRTTRIPPDTVGILIVEGGTDEAYLRIAAERLGRAGDLDGIVIHPAGGAMSAALQAIVLRAEVATPLLVLLDADTNGRRARDTLVRRFGFTNRKQVMTYAEMLEGHPPDVEAEDLFTQTLIDRFVAELGIRRPRKRLTDGHWHVDLSGGDKSRFVGWARASVRPDDLAGWGRLLDAVVDRLGVG